MADRRPRAICRARESGFDVWLPALVALLAALFMLVTARAGAAPAQAASPAAMAAPAPTASPLPIFDARRFDEGARDREAAALAVARGVYAEESPVPAPHAGHLKVTRVIVAALPELPAAVSTAITTLAAVPSAHVGAAVANPTARHDSAIRLLVSLAIAAMLAGVLVVLYRLWQRSERPPSV